MKVKKIIYRLARSVHFPWLFVFLITLNSINIRAQVIEGSSEKIKLHISKGQIQRQKDIDEDSYDTFDSTCNIRYFALLIAINDYADPEIPHLFEPISDATKLFEILTRTYTFDKSNTILLKNPTRERIINLLDSLKQVISPNDNLFIYYAGHGLYDKESEIGYWLPSDAKLRNRASWLFNSTLVDCIKSIKSKHTLLVSDACFSGSIIFRDVDMFNSANQSTKKLYAFNSRKAMTSGNLETVMDKSPFNKYLVESLAVNTKQFLNANELYVNLREAVMNATPNAQNPQFGIIIGTGDKGGEFIFRKK
jgi:hypothetical protein